MTPPAEVSAAARLEVDRKRLQSRFARAARRTRRRCDPDAIHDARVALRQLEAALDLWRSALRRRTRRRARRELKALRRALGPAREAFISLGLLGERLSDLAPEARHTIEDAHSILRSRVDRLEERAARLCVRSRTERVQRRLERAWSESTAGSDPASSWLSDARARVDLRRDRANAALREAADVGTDEALHAARVTVKRWRYALERLAAVDPAVDTSAHKWLKALQRTLGQVQDLADLRARIARLNASLAPSGTRATVVSLRGLLTTIEAERSECVDEFRRRVAATPSGAGRVPGLASLERVGPERFERRE